MGIKVQQIKHRFGIIGNAPLLNRALEVCAQVAPTDISVLVTGESGTGKEIIPQVIHQLSSRKHGEYIAVNCGAIPEGTIDSELFGHEKGSLTEKNIHQLAAHLGVSLNWFINPKIAVFGYGSIGPMWTSQLTERLAAGFAFSYNIGLGVKVKYKEHFWVSNTLVIRHESNADLKFPNSGHNSVGLRLGLVFN